MAILISHRFYHVGYEYKRLSVMAVVAAALYVLSRLIQIDTPLLSFGIRGLLAASFPLVLGVLNFYTDEEKGRLRYLLQRGWSPAGT